MSEQARIAYPRRESHHAHKLTRLLFKSCAAQRIGHHAVCLVIHIAHTEDAARYQGPVRFWNSQLMETLGFTSPKQLNLARQTAVESGWLAYRRNGTRDVGEYWTTTPPDVAGFDDKPIEEAPPILSPGGTNQDAILSPGNPNPATILSPLGMDCGTNSGMNCGKLSIPSPNPFPNTSRNECETPKRKRKECTPEFESFWLAYPPRDGRKNGKQAAFRLWLKIDAAEHPAAIQAAQAFARSSQAIANKARDAERFLKDDWWRTWAAPPETAAPRQQTLYPAAQAPRVGVRKRGH